MNTTRFARRRAAAALSVAALAVAGLAAVAPTASGAPQPHAVDAPTRVHWAKGKALGVASDRGAAAAVRNVVAQGLGRATADSLRVQGKAWTVRGVTYLRMAQYAGGLRVLDTDVKAALKGGVPISVIENLTRLSTPAAARITADRARTIAIDSIYHGHPVTWTQAPSVERVAVPMSNGRLVEGFVVTTWDADNQLRETAVDGFGAVIGSDLRTAEDSYNVFPEDPESGAQTLVSNPADAAASPLGWLSGEQFTTAISGPNTRAYLDTDDNNKPDPASTPVTDGVFDTVFDPTVQPSTSSNQEVAVQNLFYLNNLIHDALFTAGFTPEAGNFEGRDPVLAEAQDGSGTDNANFATPRDGRSGRMQMYLWSVPGTSEVVQNGVSYDAPVAEFSAPLTVAGTTGPLVLANDNTGVTSDACEAVETVPAGSVVIADRGTCTFALKAANIAASGAAGMIVANNVAGAPFVMGGEVRRFTLPAVMVSQADGTTLKSFAPDAVTLRLVDPAPPMKDGDLDSDIVWHEYGHGLTWRMIGDMSGPVSGGIGEGMSDVLALIANDDPVVGEYSSSDPLGIRSHSYEDYDSFRTYADVPFTQVHDTGELYGAIGWELWKSYETALLTKADLRFDLVQGMNFTPAGPSFEDMRSGILQGLVANGHGDRTCMVWKAFATLGVGVGSSATVSRRGVVTVQESFAVPNGC